MPDTGAPWNIPYVASTDLVSDWPTDSQELAEAIADALDDAGNAGIGTNVVSATKTSVFTTTSSTPTNVTGLSATITPTSDTSKILIIANLFLSLANTGGDQSPFARLARGATGIYIGDASSNRTQASTMAYVAPGSTSIELYGYTTSMMYLDSPATTSATTYNVQVWRTGGGTVKVGSLSSDQDNDAHGRMPASITVIEVAA